MARPRKMLGPRPGKENLLIKRTREKNPETVTEALEGVHKSGEYTGFLKDGNIVRKPDYVPPTEVLDADEKVLKKAIQALLASVIIPNPLSTKSTPEADKRSLVNKLNRLTFKELKNFLPSRIKRLSVEKLQAAELSDEDKTEIQDLYKNISP